MNRAIQVTSGIAVFIISLLNAVAVVKVIPYQGDMPTAHYISVTVTALAVAFAFLGGYILVFGKAK